MSNLPLVVYEIIQCLSRAILRDENQQIYRGKMLLNPANTLKVACLFRSSIQLLECLEAIATRSACTCQINDPLLIMVMAIQLLGIWSRLHCTNTLPSHTGHRWRDDLQTKGPSPFIVKCDQVNECPPPSY